jgi:DNA-binding MarR family transcriptional regulator
MSPPIIKRKEMPVIKTTAEHNQAFAAKLSNNLPRLLREFSRDFDRRVCEGLFARGHTNIRTSHITVLGNLGMGDVRVAALARHSKMTQQAMGKILKDLERLDYVKRSIDDVDKRAKEIQLTARGIILAQDSQDVVNQTYDQYAIKVGSKQLQDLEQSLRSAVHKLHLHNMPTSWTNP